MNLTKPNPIYVDAKQLSSLIGMPEWSIRKHVREGRIPAYRFGRKNYLFKVEEVVKIIEESRV
jgi:excisionase family DNA binding protein